MEDGNDIDDDDDDDDANKIPRMPLKESISESFVWLMAQGARARRARGPDLMPRFCAPAMLNKGHDRYMSTPC